MSTNSASNSTAVVDRTWMRGSSPLKGAILALVLERPGHGYDLGARLGARLGPTWAIDPKRLYRMLDQLERAGLISGTVESDPENPRQHRTVYRATELAPEALRLWLETLAPARAHARRDPGEGRGGARTGRAPSAARTAPVRARVPGAAAQELRAAAARALVDGPRDGDRARRLRRPAAHRGRLGQTHSRAN